MRGLIVDGQAGPVAMIRDVGPWRVRYDFGRTSSGRLGIARIEVAPQRPDGVIPDGDGVTLALMRHVQISTVRRYLWMVNRETAARAKGQRRPPATTDTAMRRRYRKVLERYRALVETDPHPAKTIAAEMGVNRNTVRVWLLRARDQQRP